MWKVTSIAAVAIAALVGSYGAAQADSCPAPGQGVRVFTLTGTAPTPALPQPTCIAYGDGNDFDNPTIVSGQSIPANLTLIDKSDDAVAGPLTIVGQGTTAGTWSISGVSGYTDLVLVLKSGEGNLDPDWAAFLLNGATGGAWAISGSQSLSHASLYGVRCENCPNPEEPPAVPLPAPFLMMLATLLSLGFYGWYRRRVAV